MTREGLIGDEGGGVRGRVDRQQVRRPAAFRRASAVRVTLRMFLLSGMAGN